MLVSVYMCTCVCVMHFFYVVACVCSVCERVSLCVCVFLTSFSSSSALSGQRTARQCWQDGFFQALEGAIGDTSIRGPAAASSELEVNGAALHKQ